MENDQKPVKKLGIKLTAFLEREMSLTLLFWLIIFFIVFIIKILGLGVK
jgi:hypothetical protein